MGRSDLDEKDWCSARSPNGRNVCLQWFSVRHTEAANTENVCQLLNGVTILLQGKKERMKERNMIPRIICLCHHPSPQIFFSSSFSSLPPFVCVLV